MCHICAENNVRDRPPLPARFLSRNDAEANTSMSKIYARSLAKTHWVYIPPWDCPAPVVIGTEILSSPFQGLQSGPNELIY